MKGYSRYKSSLEKLIELQTPSLSLNASKDLVTCGMFVSMIWPLISSLVWEGSSHIQILKSVLPVHKSYSGLGDFHSFSFPCEKAHLLQSTHLTRKISIKLHSPLLVKWK